MRSSTYQSWGESVAGNAIPLVTEPRRLFEAKHFPRAYGLAQIFSEELAKNILVRTINLTETSESEISNFAKLLRDHKEKIEFLVTYAARLSEELQAQLGAMQERLIDQTIDLKRDTMYVACKAKSVVAPRRKLRLSISNALPRSRSPCRSVP